MTQFSPIDYGQQVQPNLTGVREMEGAVEEHGQKLVGAERNLAQAAETTADTYAKNILHRQVADSMAKAAEGTEKALNVIETNPYEMPRDTLAQSVDPELASQLWQKAEAAGAVTRDDEGHEFVATHAIGRDLYMAMAKKSREDAASGISLPGWRNEFLKSAETESLAKQERYVDPKLASMRVAYDQSKTLQSADKMAKAAMTPDDFRAPIRLIETSPSFSEPAKAAKVAEYKDRQDSVIIDKAMTNPVANEDILKSELQKLQGPRAKFDYPNHDEKWRAEEAHHVMTGLKMAELQRQSALDAQANADKSADDTRTLAAIKGLLTKNIDPAALFDKAGIEGSGAQALWTGYKTKEGIENFYHVAETFRKNAQASPKEDAPGAFAAMTDMYVKDPEAFSKALFSGQTVKTPYGNFNFTTDLSEQSMHHFMDKAAGLGDKQRAQEDRVKEEALDRRVAVVMTDPEGGGVDAADFANSQERPQFAAHEQFVRDALTEAQRNAVGGKKLTPEKETEVMMNAAAEYRKSGKASWGGLGSPNPALGVVIQTHRGDVALPLSERTAMSQARQDSGHVGITSFQTDGTDFYNNYKDAIEAGWKQALPDEPLTKEAAYRVFYEAKRLSFGQTPITDPATQVAFLLQKLARSNAVKKSGGTK